MARHLALNLPGLPFLATPGWQRYTLASGYDSFPNTTPCGALANGYPVCLGASPCQKAGALHP